MEDQPTLTSNLMVTHSAQETISVGRILARSLPKKAFIALFGELGAGKTTLVKGVIAELSQLQIDEINSPTFTYLHPYEGSRPLYHFDLYRIEDERDFLAKGLNEYFNLEAICLVEWAEKIPSLLPLPRQQITIEGLSKTSRKITIKELL